MAWNRQLGQSCQVDLPFSSLSSGKLQPVRLTGSILLENRKAGAGGTWREAVGETRRGDLARKRAMANGLEGRIQLS